MFKIGIHRDIVQEAFKNKIKSKYLRVLRQEVGLVDFYAWEDEKLHFDNNTFSSANSHRNYVYSNIIPDWDYKVRSVVKTTRYTNVIQKDIFSVLQWFAQILHMTQDYWSHSNAIEEELRFTDTPIMSGIFTLKQFIAWDSPKNAYWHTYKKHQNRVIDHEFLNKDNDSSYEGRIIVNGKTLFKHAYDRSVIDTNFQLLRFKLQAPETWCRIKK
jgi:hypothetical protein